MEEKIEKRYGIGTCINDLEDWNKFKEVFNSAFSSEENGPRLGANAVVDETKLPGLVALESYTEEELKNAWESTDGTRYPWEVIEPILKIVGEDYPICFHRMWN